MTAEKEGVWALGLMSGTSLDGIDAALIRTDGEYVFEFGEWLTIPYEGDFKTRLRDAVRSKGDILAVKREITLRHADAVEQLLKQAKLTYKDISVIGFHGQTVIHRPEEHITWQIGDGALLAEKTRIDVVCDFRSRDIATGGQGAPLIPLYQAALARRMELPIAVLNIGGLANVTWIGRSEINSRDLLDLDILAMDTGPGNVMLNEWTFKHTQKDYDKDGQLALAGNCNNAIVASMMEDDYFTRTPPKSLDRNHFSLDPLSSLSVEDGAATLVEFIATTAKASAQYFPRPAHQWFVTGGGRHNPAIMQALSRHFDNKCYPVESLGWIGDAVEAQGFGFLAVRSLNGQAITLPTTTGAIRATKGGAYYRA